MGLTQLQFAARLGVSSITVHRWESGKSRPQRLVLARLRELEGERGERDARGERAVAVASASAPPLDFAGNPERISAVAEALRLAHGRQFNPAPRLVRVRDPFATLPASKRGTSTYDISAASLLKAAERTEPHVYATRYDG